MKVGFIGQGFIGKNYADDFENRDYEVVRYALEEPYVQNKDKIKDCEVVFIAVWTPTTEEGFDISILESTLEHVADGSIAVIKSTTLPGSSAKLQAKNPKKIILFSPEFLREATAAEDAAKPPRNIVGYTIDSDEQKRAAALVMEILPKAPYEKITDSLSAEFLKYVSNNVPYVKIIYLNLIYDLIEKQGGDWENLKELLMNEPYLAPHHLDPVHKSGRGAGGNCLIKDFAALREMYEELIGDELGIAFMKAAEKKNISLLKASKKDIKVLEGVYGPNSDVSN